ncbi:hypothetical protein VTJ83DRAFT_180 [Remersonia thermophila]|uniref:Kinesin motor domain-containing protein n=1 Tax=Remersonia thermophila TaxID=72144 RepID=A0ABR4DMQ4_9PEZI
MERRNPSMASRTGTGRSSSIRPGTATRSTAPSRLAMTRNAPSRLARAASPAESLASVATAAAGTKRKERDFDPDDGEGGTNITVVVRCRGRNEREVKENSAVVVRTEATKGTTIELSMGPNAVSNKTYTFDRVFSQAADQKMVFDEAVRPVLDEMLAGYNCTIFAYGQTGTGKTYTMSGDLTETLGMLSDNAGIIPRVLQALFQQLELDEREHSVRCSFIELYNEELRDLLAGDDGSKLKIYDDTSRKGHSTTMVQGMEERHILNAGDGLRWLREGSVKRQVAATKCNDLSSRSHTVFTITVYARHKPDGGGAAAASGKAAAADPGADDYLMLGKLNLVDLAGSENIQRSGAENKRAAEAGLINKSLLTLGRVINALVDRSPHIPYRESKLTRLLQDSLGGRTKTCIIATISPARSNLDETISTLDYAFRAKNIRNRPQLNALTAKKTLLRDLAADIERLKAELIATRQRNGVYLSNDMYEELTVQNESRRILTEEQAAKIETLEANLKHKLQELLALTSSFMGLKREHEGALARLGETAGLLGQTELVLAATRKALAEETHLRRAHQATEERLAAAGGDLLRAVERAVGDIGALRDRDRRRAELAALNRDAWDLSRSRVAGVTELVEGRLDAFRRAHEDHVDAVARRVRGFVGDELGRLEAARAALDDNLDRLAESKAALLDQQERSRADADGALDEIKAVRDHVKQRVGEGLQAVAGAAERIAGDVLGELAALHGHLHASYAALGQDLKAAFDELLRHMRAQKAEADRLRHELEAAARAAVESNEAVAARLDEALREERAQAAAERQAMLAQLARLVTAQAEEHESRLAGKAAALREALAGSSEALEAGVADYASGMRLWADRDAKAIDDAAGARDALKARLKDDGAVAGQHGASIQAAARSAHAEATRAVEEQMRDVDAQMQDLDALVARAKARHAGDGVRNAQLADGLAAAAERCLADVAEHLDGGLARARALGRDVDAAAEQLAGSLSPLRHDACGPLADLRRHVLAAAPREYEPTGATPDPRARYDYPTHLPRTAAHDALLAALRDADAPPASPCPAAAAAAAAAVVVHDDDDDDNDDDDDHHEPSEEPSAASPTPRGKKPTVLPDITLTPVRSPVRPAAETPQSLREVDPNLASNGQPPAQHVLSPAVKGGRAAAAAAAAVSLAPQSEATRMPPPKVAAAAAASAATATGTGRTRASRLAKRVVADGAENLPPVGITRGGSRRKSPRLH